MLSFKWLQAEGSTTFGALTANFLCNTINRSQGDASTLTDCSLMWLAEGLWVRSTHRQGPSEVNAPPLQSLVGLKAARHRWRWKWGSCQWSPEGLDGVGWEELHHYLEVVVLLDQSRGRAWRGCLISNVRPEERSSHAKSEMLFNVEENDRVLHIRNCKERLKGFIFLFK